MTKRTWIPIMLLVFLIACKGTCRKDGVPNKHKILLSDSTDQAIFDSMKNLAWENSFELLELQERMVEIGKLFLQTPYVGGTLENAGQEKLVVNFRGLDCVTYLENVVALSRAFSEKDANEVAFLRELELLRYRDGRLAGYPSRLHYFTDWIFNNERKGILENVTAKIGGEKYSKNINFMSTHADNYAALKANPSLVREIQAIEERINRRDMYYIPEEKIKSLESSINNGDLIAITTNIKGLEISHVGIALHVNERLHLMHASIIAKEAVISEKPLAEMLLGNKNQSGIMVARLLKSQQPTN